MDPDGHIIIFSAVKCEYVKSIRIAVRQYMVIILAICTFEKSNLEQLKLIKVIYFIVYSLKTVPNKSLLYYCNGISTAINLPSSSTKVSPKTRRYGTTSILVTACRVDNWFGYKIAWPATPKAIRNTNSKRRKEIKSPH